ncbi:glycosyltransferase family 39 protein [Aliiroseovarius sediminis]|uniref:ArnT family glycosyltransferase n=1 Tax=Aliiroseovarius sediminis TaxID=2925839 RepID=UPI001F564026|nr:glycosyltransferase family 39 protein [Aliiroseovarius sediminis]MCI2394929.1 glycosyltransferase family 39 protein [Aliiroseovarius sediminis]
MTPTVAARWTLFAFFLVAVAGVFLRPLTPIDETRYVAVAWEMWQSGNYFVPTKNYDIYTHKPPLLFWAINLMWMFTGVSEFAARLVGPLFAVLSIVLTGRLARKLGAEDATIGPRAVMVLSAMLLFAISGGLTMFDALLTCTTLAGYLALVNAVDTGARRWWAAVGVAIALGVLAKGPVILVHLGPAMLLTPLWARTRRKVSWPSTFAGVGIALATALGVVALWLVPAIVIGGAEYRDEVLWTQSAGRISASFAHARPWWWFATLLPFLLFPWFFVPSVWKAAITARWQDTGLALPAIWAMSALVLFSLISGKQVHYLVPELPAVALIVAGLLPERPAFRPLLASVPLLLAAVAAMLAGAGFVDLGSAAPLLDPQTNLLAWGLFMLAVCWLAVRLGGLPGALTLTLGTALSLNVLIGVSAIHGIFDTKRIASIVAPHQGDGIAYVGRQYNAEFNFAGRLTEPVTEIIDPAGLPAWMTQHPDGLIIGRPDEVGATWPPYRNILFRNAPHAIWRVTDASNPEPSS